MRGRGAASSLIFLCLSTAQSCSARSVVGAYSHKQYPQLLCFSFSPRSLLILFVEIDYWERLLFETPHYVVNVAERAEDLRVLRENLLLVARDYNK